MASVDSASDDRTVNNTMRHQYRVLNEAEKANMAAIKDEGLKFHSLLNGMGKSREISLALTKVEEAVMWGVKHITAVLIVAIALALFGAHAFAQTPGTADQVVQCGAAGSGCAIIIQPWVELLQPYLLAIATAAVPVLAAWLAPLLKKYLHVSLTAGQLAQLDSYATTQAGAIIASGAAGISSETIHVNDPRIAAAANALPTEAKVIAAALGVSPDAVVHGALGKLQSAAPAAAAAPAPA